MSPGIYQNSYTEGKIHDLSLERCQNWVERAMNKKQTWLGKVGIAAKTKIKDY